MGSRRGDLADLDRLRPNVYELVEYLRLNGTAHALAHPLHRVGATLTQSHIERFLLLFGIWEGRNGARPAEGNEAAVRIAGSASREYLEKLADKHGIAPAGSGPPALVAGSDDHGLFDVAATWTETPAAADVDELLRHVAEHRGAVAGAHGSTDALAHSVGMLAMKAAIEGGVATLPPALQGVIAGLIDQSLPEPPPGPGGDGGAVGELVMARLRRDRGFRRRIRRLGREPGGAERDHWRLRETSEWLHRTLLAAAADGSSGPLSLDALGRRAEHAAGALAVAAPYLLAAGYHRGGARFALEAERGFLGAPARGPAAPRVAMLTDTFDEANGVAGTMRRLADHAAARGGGRMTVVACGDREVDRPGLRRFARAGRMTLPVYGDRDWRLGIPSIVELLRFAEERRIEVFHAATPGPMGLIGLLLARTLGRPFVATYHTEMQRYVLELTQDRLAALVAGGAIGWFYRQAERVYVPSASSGASVVERGVDPDRVALFSRGVDVERFTPALRTPRHRRRLAPGDETIVLYVGRLSREKGVLELAAAFRLAAARRPNLRLVVVGEGTGPGRAGRGARGNAAPLRGRAAGRAPRDRVRLRGRVLHALDDGDLRPGDRRGRGERAARGGGRPRRAARAGGRRADRPRRAARRPRGARRPPRSTGRRPRAPAAPGRGRAQGRPRAPGLVRGVRRSHRRVCRAGDRRAADRGAAGPGGAPGGPRLRIVDVTQWYSPTSGGIRTYLHAKAAWAARSGEAHAAIVTGESAGCMRVAGSPFMTLRGVTPTDRWGYRLAPWPPGVLQALDRLSPGLIVLHDALAFPGTIARWAESRDVPLALFCHSDLSLGSAGLPRRLARPVGRVLAAAQRRALRLAKVVLVASQTTESAVRPHTHSVVIRSPLGIDLADFTGAEPDPELRRRLAPDGLQLVMHAGRLTSDKRVDLLVPMLAALPDGVVLAIAGYGPMEEKLVREARAADVADRLVMLGHIADRRELARTLATADCFVHPNPREPFGLGPLEALAAGCRVVAPASGGTGETLRGRGAVLVRGDDPAALAAGVRRALAGPRPHPDLSDLSWDATFSREWEIYREMAEAAGRRAG